MPKPVFGGKFGTPLPWYPIPYMQMYLDEIERREEYTESHLNAMRRSLAYFGIFLQREGIRHPEEIQRIHILHYQAWLTQDAKKQNGQVISEGYQRHLLANLRLWFGWLVAEQHITTNPWERIKIGWTVKKSRKLEPDDVLAIFEAHRRAAFTTTPFYFHRREAILAVLFAWGLTRGEVLSLNVPNLDMRQDFVVIRFARGQKQRMLPYGPELKSVISRYLAQRATKARPTEDALFIDNSGNRMSKSNIQKVLHDLGERAGVHLSAQRLRDTYGFKLLESGVDRQIIRDLLGHPRTSYVTPYDPKAWEKVNATQKLDVEVAELLGHNQQPPQYRRMS